MKKYFMPVGKSDFEKIRKDGDYYIDKTGLIQQIIENSAEVTLFTRPRRFGKTLNMSMLEHFFDIHKDSKAIFEGLEISENTPLCDEWMNRYPTIFRVVDYNGLENRRTERYRGFESLSLRKKVNAVHLFS